MHLEFVHFDAYGQCYIEFAEVDVAEVFHQDGVDAAVEECAYEEKQSFLRGHGCVWVKLRYLSAS